MRFLFVVMNDWMRESEEGYWIGKRAGKEGER